MKASEQSKERIQKLRSSFLEARAGFDPERLVFVDEAGSHIAMTRTHGRAPRGQLLVDSTPRNRGVVTTMIGALSLRGIEAMMTIEGGTSGPVFEAYTRELLCPQLRPGDIVVLDNAAAHKTAGVREAIESVGAKLIFLPPYSPEFNPIELAWSFIKRFLRTAKPRTTEAIDNAVAMAMAMISSTNAENWFKHCGY